MTCSRGRLRVQSCRLSQPSQPLLSEVIILSAEDHGPLPRVHQLEHQPSRHPLVQLKILLQNIVQVKGEDQKIIGYDSI